MKDEQLSVTNNVHAQKYVYVKPGLGSTPYPSIVIVQLPACGFTLISYIPVYSSYSQPTYIQTALSGFAQNAACKMAVELQYYTDMPVTTHVNEKSTSHPVCKAGTLVSTHSSSTLHALLQNLGLS